MTISWLYYYYYYYYHHHHHHHNHHRQHLLLLLSVFFGLIVIVSIFFMNYTTTSKSKCAHVSALSGSSSRSPQEWLKNLGDNNNNFIYLFSRLYNISTSSCAHLTITIIITTSSNTCNWLELRFLSLYY